MARSTASTGAATLVNDAVARAAALWPAATRVCVAYSGGSDSTVLLHALAELRGQMPSHFALTAHHVHHGLSTNADAWAAHCAEQCAALGVPLTVTRVDVNTQTGSGIEASARNARFAALDQLDVDVIVLAHHARDQAETLLLQLLRGSGPAGLAAMPGVAFRYARPLLNLPKTALQNYAEAHALSWIEDESNADNRFSRNRLRNTVWPALIGAFPAAENTLVRAAEHQADASILLDELAAIDALSCVSSTALNLLPFNALSQARRANLLRYWLRELGVATPATHTLREWLKQLTSTAAIQAVELRGGAQGQAIRVYRGQAFLVQDAPHWDPCRWLGETQLILKNSRVIAGEIRFVSAANLHALRSPRADETWALRSRREGDAIKLTERSGHVALKNVLQQANIPPWLRATWPLLTCNEEIAAVASVATAKAFNVAHDKTGWACEWKPAWTAKARS
jgi:tRNA(Ile)-lysidine synthase